jgi:hypothetical protein
MSLIKRQKIDVVEDEAVKVTTPQSLQETDVHQGRAVENIRGHLELEISIKTWKHSSGPPP